MEMKYLFETIIKNIKQSLLITDSNGKLEFFNASTEKMWNYSEEELKNMNINDLFYFESSYTEGNKISQISDLFLFENWNGEIYAKNKENSVFCLKVSICQIFEENSNVKKYLIISENIEEKKSLLSQLKLKDEELQKSIKNLENAQFMMIEEDKLANLGHLSAGIAHEINNPLGFIISNFGTLKKYVEKLNEIILLYKSLLANSEEGMCLVKDEVANVESLERKYNLDFIMDDIDELLKDTEGGIERVQKIIAAMRNFAHSSLEKNFEQYDLNYGITNTLVIAKNEIKYNSNIEIELDEIPQVEAIPSEINQVILNLIINSSHAIKEKQENADLDYFGLLKIYTFSDDLFVSCVIEDNGTGIPKENLDKIFEPFFTTKPIGKGTGLGLSIAYDIIKNTHKGDLIVDSVLGEGTKVTIKLPIRHEEQEEVTQNE